MLWYTYTLKCRNDTYYVGHTHDLNLRCVRHATKTGARHTAQNGVAELLYHEPFGTELDAIRRERQIKRWSRAKKEALIVGDMAKLSLLSRSRD